MAQGAVVALSHGGGPLPVLGDPRHEEIAHSLREKVPQILKLSDVDRPRAIILVTAHWSTSRPIISSSPRHNLYYDYYNFPPESYGLKYDAAGSPSVAQEVFQALTAAGLDPELDYRRGWDHGLFIPMMLIRPQADIPIVQLSVLTSESPEKHFRIGQALRVLRASNVAIIGSGFASLHNLQVMQSGTVREPSFRLRNAEWNEAVTKAVKQRRAGARLDSLKGWRQFPHSFEMHPDGGAEHFLPLIVCAGSAGEGEAEMYTDRFMDLPMFSYYWP